MKRAVEKLTELSAVSVLAIVLMVGLGSAALLTNYGTVQGQADVNQSVTVNGEDQDDSGYAFSYSYDATGGDLVTESTTLQNNADQPATVNIYSSQNEPGLTTRYVLNDEWNMDSETDDVVNISVEASDQNVASGNYSVHFNSEGDSTDDYVRVFYPASSVTESDSLSYTGVANAQNPLDDEVWLVTSDGDQYYAHGANTTSSAGDGLTTATYEMDRTWYDADTQSPASPNFGDVVAVGIGQGAPNAGDYTVDTYVDNVQLSGTNVDEISDMEIDVLPTGDFNGGSSEYRVNIVTDFQINVESDNYFIYTRVDPVTS